MNYEMAAKKWTELDEAIDAIDREAKKQKAELKKIQVDLENWFALKAQEEGLKNIPTNLGTVYWSTHYSATTAEPAVFRAFVISNGAWDLIEARAAKLAVKAYIEGHGAPPPGVNFSSIRVFNLKRAPKE